jgi:phosphoribosylformimino-5-aminoimidazole carboxamide ribotide isomerase
MLILPAIDITDGTIVRLCRGDFSRITRYPSRPEEAAAACVQAGFPFLHVVDLDGARSGAVVNHRSLKAIASVPGVRLQAGGGVRSRADVESLLELGAERIVLGSLVVERPAAFEELLSEFSPERFVVALDVWHGRIAIRGWQEETDRTLESILGGLRAAGIRRILCTDIERDGMMSGPNIGLYRHLLDRFPDLQLIASGGIAIQKDVENLAAAGIPAAVIGRALHEGSIRLEDLQRWERSQC